VNDFQFTLGRGQRNVETELTLPGDRNDPVGAYLIGPDGQVQGFGQNSFGLDGSKQSLSASVLDPVPGTWTLAVDFAAPTVGDRVALPFHGTISTNSTTTKAVATGLPDSPGIKLKRKVRVKVKVKITNSGPAPEAYFIDPRLARTTTFDLDSDTGQTFLLPLTDGPQWLVPTHVSSARITARATLPLVFDWGPAQGDPDLFAGSLAAPQKRVAASFTPSGGQLQPGLWIASPDELGPFPKGAAAGRVTLEMAVRTRAFDSAMTPGTGDLWRLARNVDAPIIPQNIAVGATRTITVTLRPNAPAGTVVRGDLYIDDYLSAVPPSGAASGNELIAIPYSYTVR
jgi:hypothetical protein